MADAGGAALPEDLNRLYNYFEVMLWGGIGLAFLITGIRRQAGRRSSFLASGAFILFGISDLVEVHTGAWWTPWWLLMWKGACLAILAALACCYFGGRRTGGAEGARSNTTADDSA
jgi:hypothetical protein